MTLTGLFPVLPTPFDSAGAPDPAAFAGLIDFAVEAGADGVAFPGMASEVETLTPDERADLVRLLGERLAGARPFIVGASDADPAAVARHAAQGAAAGAAAAMVMAPARLGAEVAAHAAYFAEVGAAGLPVMLQNAPAPMGAGLAPEAVAAVAAAVPAIAYVKEETAPCGQHVSRILAAAPSLRGVFGGAGARFIMDELARGAAGAMPALEVADVHARLFTAWRSGDHAAARRLYSRTLPLLMFQQTFRVRATKAVLAARGLLRGDAARAAGPGLDAGDRAELSALLAEAADLFAIHPLREAVHAD